MTVLAEEFLCALRALRKSPGYAIAAILPLAAGIAVNTTAFSVLDQFGGRSVMRGAPADLAEIRVEGPETLRYGDYLYLREHARSFQTVFAVRDEEFTVVREGHAEFLAVAAVSPDALEGMGAQLQAGRFPAGDPDAVLLTPAYWKRAYGGDPGAVGTQVLLAGNDGQSRRVIAGITRDEFRVDLLNAPLIVPIDDRHRRAAVKVYGRLRAGVTAERAATQTAALIKTMRGASTVPRVRVHPVSEPLLPGPVRILVQCVVSLVLMIVCANVANLILARNEGRHAELGIRLALGAGRRHIARWLIAETAVLSLAAVLLGLLCAGWCNYAIENIRLPGVPESFALRFQIDVRAVVFAVSAALVACVISNLVPLRAAWRIDVASWLKAKDRRGGIGLRLGWRGLFVSVQLALSLAWLTAATMCVRGLLNETQADPGFDRGNGLVAGLWCGAGQTRAPALRTEVLDRLRGESWVRSAATAWLAPVALHGWQTDVHRADLPGAEQIWVSANAVGDGFFRTMGVPLLLGREFDRTDLRRNVVIVNQTLARQFWPGESPLGREIIAGGSLAGTYQVIAVARDSMHHEVRDRRQPYLYLPQRDASNFRVIVRTAGDPTMHLERLRAIVRSYEPDLAVMDLRTLEQSVEDAMFWSRLTTWTAIGVAAAALLLCALGVYSIVSYLVTRSTRDIGIRMALGASRREILVTVFRRGAVLAGGGLGAGLLLSLGVAALLANVVYGVAPMDPLALGTAALVLCVAAGLAIYLPARRAAALDPLAALRRE